MLNKREKMRHFILDTNIIIRDPAILAKGNGLIRFVIPESVLLELASYEQSRESGSRILELVRNALNHGAFQLGIPSNEALALSQLESVTTPRLSIGDFTIAKSVEYYQKQLFPSESENIFFVTDHIRLAQYVKSLGVNTIDSSALKDSLADSSSINQDVQRKATSVIFLQRKELIIGLVSGVIVSVLSNFVAANINALGNTINIWGTIALIPIVGVSLYWFRSRNRLAYGIAEVLFGLMTGLRVFIPNFDYSQLDSTGLIQVAGSLYIMVRGLDNIGKGVVGTRFEVTWKRLFREP